MRSLAKFSLLGLLLLFLSCSIAPDVPVTKEALDETKIYERFVIEENPETIIYVLNKKGEMVVRAMYRNTPVYIKIFATSRGILWYVYPR
ncbi:MAG: hypothetical protein N2999_03140 [Proteobacteria bacterium]|nr:hypothetical protein [Pseudomonadota bacterium]